MKVRVREYPDGTLTEEIRLFPKVIEKPISDMVFEAFEQEDYKYLGVHPDGYKVYLVNLRD